MLFFHPPFVLGKVNPLKSTLPPAPEPLPPKPPPSRRSAFLSHRQVRSVQMKVSLLENRLHQAENLTKVRSKDDDGGGAN